MTCKHFNLVLFKYVQFSDDASIYPGEFELKSNGGFGSNTAWLKHFHSDKPVIVRYATGTGS